MPIGGGAPQAMPAPAPFPTIIIPELQPDIPKLISPLPVPFETSPDVTQSAPPSYPTITRTPSTGITAEQAEASRSTGVQVRPSSGVQAESNPLVQPVPEQGQRPNVNNPERLPTFYARQSQAATNSESAVDKLLEIEQVLTRLRISISSLQPQTSATDLSSTIQTFEREIASLRSRATTLSPETTTQELENIRNRLRQTSSRITALQPSAQSHLADLQRQGIERQIDQQISGLRGNLGTPQEQAGANTGIQTATQSETNTQAQTQLQTTLQGLQEQLTNLGLGIALVTPLVAPITQTAVNTSPVALRDAAAAGTCDTLKPGGYLNNQFNNLNNNLNNGLQGLPQNLDLALQAGQGALLQTMNNTLNLLNTKIGDVGAIGSVGTFLNNLGDWAGTSRLMEIITMVGVLHNSLMLSNNIELTLFQIIDNVIAIPTLIVNPKGETVHTQDAFNNTVRDFFKGILGVKGYEDLQAAWKALNMISSTGANVWSNVQGIIGDTQTIQNITNEWVAQLGNALHNEGLLGDDNWEPKPEKPLFRSRTLAKLEGIANGIQAADSALQSINTVTQALLDVVQQGNQIKDNLGELNKAKDDAVAAAKKLYEEEIDKIQLPDFSSDDLY